MTKHRAIIKTLTKHGYRLVQGSGSEDHEKYTDGFLTVAVPGHRMIGNTLAQIIYKEAGILRRDWRL